MTTVEEEKKWNPRLAKTKEEFVKIMENLNLPYPKYIGEFFHTATSIVGKHACTICNYM